MHETADRIIYLSLGVLVLFGILSFFKVPMYEKGAWLVIGAASSALTGALGFKFGVTNATPQADAQPQAPSAPTLPPVS